MPDQPSHKQILASLQSESKTSSELRKELGVTKNGKLGFKQLLADMLESGLLVRNGFKQYLLPDATGRAAEPEAPIKPEPHGRRDRNAPRRGFSPDLDSSKKRGTLRRKGEEWEVVEAGTEKVFPIAHKAQAPGKEGQAVVFSTYPHPRFKHEMLAKVSQPLQDYGTWREVTQQFLIDQSLPLEFPAKVRKEVAALSEPGPEEFAKREDFTGVSVLCIDPLGARDHDDAVSVEPLENGGYRLGVHIADVSWFVQEGSAIDEEALERSYTQYLPWVAVPMLPERLSSDLCSLNENEPRMAFSCLMMLDGQARVQSYRFVRTVINVRRSITYEQAMELMDAKDAEVLQLAKVARLLKADRRRTGVLELNSPEYKCEFDEKGEPKRIVERSNVESNSWIEECMLIANQCCAKELVIRKLQGIYRIHESPDVRDIHELAAMEADLFKDSPVLLRDIGKSRQGDSNLNPTIFKLFQHLVTRAQGNDAAIMRILRSMQKAHYDSNSFGHFALNWQDYAHFTSPIRRYADLWCHRELARDAKSAKKARKNDIVTVCDLISANEITNQKKERVAIKICGVWLLKDRVGELFEASINGIEEWGLFVSVKDPLSEGLVRYRDLPGNDFFIFNRDKGLVYGRRSGLSFRRGDKVEVMLLRANPMKGEADFSIVRKIDLKEAAQVEKEAAAHEDDRDWMVPGKEQGFRWKSPANTRKH